MIMKNVMPILPPRSFPTVDVRDVALAHIKAMKLKEAAGKRYINAHTRPLGSISTVFDNPVHGQLVAPTALGALGALYASVSCMKKPGSFLHLSFEREE